jgi:hypothetical protein
MKKIIRNIILVVIVVLFIVFQMIFKNYKEVGKYYFGVIGITGALKTILDYFLGLNMTYQYSKDVGKNTQNKYFRRYLLIAATVFLFVFIYGMVFWLR